MELKNYQEDVVLGLIDVLLDNQPELKDDSKFVYDVAAYTLNRIPPKYFMSERGFTRFVDLYLLEEDDQKSFVNLVELSLIVNTAIETVKKRRNGHNETKKHKEKTVEPAPEYIHNFPHILGRVFDAAMDTPLTNAEVTLKLNGKPAETVGPGWPNPYITSKATKGYFSFWPKHRTDKAQNLQHEAVVKVLCDGYKPYRIERVIETNGGFELQEVIRNESIINLEHCLLQPEE